jgi:shikimate kinase
MSSCATETRSSRRCERSGQLAVIFLIGMMGVGKTTVGRQLAARLRRAFLDSDAQVQANTGKTVPEIFADSGEAAFRAEEKRALREAASSKAPAVVAVAGGAVLDPENRALLQSVGTVVWLRASVKTMAKRVGSGAGRPLLGDDPAGALATLYAQREPLYEELADITVDVDAIEADAVVDKIVAALA